MVTIRPGGEVSDKKTLWRTIVDFFQGIYNFLSLLILAFFDPSQVKRAKKLSSHNNNARTVGRINPSGVRRSNIRDVKSLGLQGQGGCGGGG